MASVEPSTNHLVMSPIWITISLQEDNGKRTAPCPRPLPASMEALSLLLPIGFEYSWVTPVVSNQDPLARMLIISTVYFSVRQRQRKRVEK